MTCILRENLEAKADKHDKTLILASALMGRPFGANVTYAEVLFDLITVERKIQWFQRFVTLHTASCFFFFFFSAKTANGLRAATSNAFYALHYILCGITELDVSSMRRTPSLASVARQSQSRDSQSEI